MDQAAYEQLLRDYEQFCRTQQSVPDLTVSVGSVGGPIVVLVHGIGGNAQHWTDPLSLNPDDTWLFDLNTKPPVGGGGIVRSRPYAPGSVMPWGDLLRDQQISWVTWSQAQSSGPLDIAVREAVNVLSALESRVFAPLAADVATPGGTVPSLILLCHSRGGLVARAALKELSSAGVPHLRRVITISTPHRGSYMPRLAQVYNDSLSNAIDFSSLEHSLPGPIRAIVAHRIEPLLADLANRVREALLHAFGTISQGPGFDELVPGSAMLQALEAGEQPLPGVEYVAFAGSQPAFVQFYLSAAGQVVRFLGVVGPFLIGRLRLIPGLLAQFGGLVELEQGDSAVGLPSSHWPDAFGASHQVLPINHMQALVDPALQQAVLPHLQN
jgi:pimeloyl-ACP methyl ester carboxylesterase